MRNKLFFAIIFYENTGGNIIREETVQQLLKITKPKKFMKDDYICYEGQPGNEFFNSLNKSATALSLASIMINCGDYKEVLQYLSVALESTDESIKEIAMMVQQQFEKQKKS